MELKNLRTPILFGIVAGVVLTLLVHRVIEAVYVQRSARLSGEITQNQLPENEGITSLYHLPLRSVQHGTTGYIEEREDHLALVAVLNVTDKGCQNLVTSLDSLYQKLKAENLDFYFLCVEPEYTVKHLALENGWQLPFYTYEGELPAELGGDLLPKVALLHRRGLRFLGAGLGPLCQDELERTIRQALLKR